MGPGTIEPLYHHTSGTDSNTITYRPLDRDNPKLLSIEHCGIGNAMNRWDLALSPM